MSGIENRLSKIASKLKNNIDLTDNENKFITRCYESDELFNIAQYIVCNFDLNPFVYKIEEELIQFTITQFNSYLNNSENMTLGLSSFVLYSSNEQRERHNIHADNWNIFEKILSFDKKFLNSLKQNSTIINDIINSYTDNNYFVKCCKKHDDVEVLLSLVIIRFIWLFYFDGKQQQRISFYDSEKKFVEIFESIHYIFNGIMYVTINKDSDVFSNTLDSMIYTKGFLDSLMFYILVDLYSYYRHRDTMVKNRKINDVVKKMILKNSNSIKIFIEDKYIKKLVAIIRDNESFKNMIDEYEVGSEFIYYFKNYCIEDSQNKSINILKL